MIVQKRREQRAPERARIKVYTAQIKTRGQRKSDDADGGEAGIFEALVSVFGNVDSYGERVLAGAFTKTLDEWGQRGDPIPVIWAHEWDNPEAHIGEVLEVEEREDGLWVKAQVDLGEPLADKVWRLMVRRRVTNFSFAYDVLDSAESDESFDDPLWGELPIIELKSLRLYEVGPCLVGVNQQTDLLATKARALAVRGQKSAMGAISSHSTPTDAGSWDGPANEARLSNDAGADVYRRAFAWVDPDADPDTKAAYRFIHHFVSADGAVGAASTVACSTGIGILNGGRGGTTIPEGDRQGVYNHLARHLRDADLEPPELQSRSRSKDGRELSSKNQQQLGAVLEHARTIVDTVEQMLDSGEPEEDSEKSKFAAPGTRPTFRAASPSPRWSISAVRALSSGRRLTGGSNGSEFNLGSSPRSTEHRRPRRE